MNANAHPHQESDNRPGFESPPAVILFDGVCNLCNSFINFVFDRDPTAYFVVGSLQSESASAYLASFDVEAEALDTVVLIENGRLYTKSTAALRIFRHLSGPWPLLSAFLAVPRSVRDRVYDMIAANRYDWFGIRDQCRMPTPDVTDRFLE